jgi:hypothetical protein
MADFTYFDQYLDVTVDLSPYIALVNSTNNFNYSFTNLQPIKVPLKNIFDKISIVNTFNKDILNFKFWIIEEDERPENTAYQYYEDKELWWAVLVFNNIKNVFEDWPVNEKILSAQADQLFASDGKYSRSTYYDLLHERNEKKRLIKLIKPEIINEVIASFRSEFEKSLH